MLEGLVERIMARVEFDPNSGCWLWPGSPIRGGYGQICTGHSTFRKVHRVMFEWGCPDIYVKELFVLHRCDTPACCNPGHLFQGTHADNMADMARKGRSFLQKHPERSVLGRHLFRAQGEDSPKAKLTNEEVREIRAAYVPHKVTLAFLAAKYGVHLSSIYNAVKGRTYSVVT